LLLLFPGIEENLPPFTLSTHICVPHTHNSCFHHFRGEKKTRAASPPPSPLNLCRPPTLANQPIQSASPPPSPLNLCRPPTLANQPIQSVPIQFSEHSPTFALPFPAPNTPWFCAVQSPIVVVSALCHAHKLRAAVFISLQELIVIIILLVGSIRTDHQELSIPCTNLTCILPEENLKNSHKTQSHHNESSSTGNSRRNKLSTSKVSSLSIYSQLHNHSNNYYVRFWVLFLHFLLQ
jgi:hypothetical protein